jgi:hypothetical protein
VLLGSPLSKCFGERRTFDMLLGSLCIWKQKANKLPQAREGKSPIFFWGANRLHAYVGYVLTCFGGQVVDMRALPWQASANITLSSLITSVFFAAPTTPYNYTKHWSHKRLSAPLKKRILASSLVRLATTRLVPPLRDLYRHCETFCMHQSRISASARLLKQTLFVTFGILGGGRISKHMRYPALC